MIENALLLDAFKLPDKEAIAFLKEKGYRFSWRWEEVYGAAHTRVFTVAKVTRLDILQDLLDGLKRAEEEGTLFAAFQDSVEPLLRKKGWWGRVPDPTDPTKTVQLGSPARLKTIFHTNTQQAMARGQWQRIQRVKKARPYVQYSAILDGATRPAHRALHGRVFRVDDPILKIIAPKNGHGCRCSLKSLSAADVKRLGLSVEPPATVLEREVLISRATGEVRTVKGAKLKDGTTFFPDAGFDYNPGETDWSPVLSGYDPALQRAYKKEKP